MLLGIPIVPDDILKQIVPDLDKSLRLMAEQSVVLQREWAFLRRNLSGKYNVVQLGSGTSSFDRFKNDRGISVPDGVYVTPCKT